MDSIKTLNSITDTLLQSPSALSQSDRRQVLQACDRLRAFESPADSITRLVFSAHQLMALRLGIDSKLFDAIAAHVDSVKAAERNPEQSSESIPLNLSEIYESSRADPLLIRRIVRFLVAMNVLHEVDQDHFISTPFAATLVSSSPFSAAVIHSTHFTTVLSRLPEYFHANGWKCPDDGLNGPFQFALDTKGHYFDFLSSTPYYGQAFDTVMSMPFRRRGRDWFDFYPVANRLSVTNDSQTLLEYDFFQAQPVRGAKAYFMRTVLHDWPDKQAKVILGRVRDAMSFDSVLLISETLLPESGALLPSVISDMQMMGSFASLERTEYQWRVLLEDSGLELVHIWLPEGCDNARSLAEQPALLEAKLKSQQC
ncbi:hypothetical protein N7450_008081 [Penicillium hetheringtonii]|uniref:O-methyltransferase C-terminal domain-containing protein n=1 Tax=Penicillium hetheringtonii TaxID=911720 RepID=A0AAD6GPJ9_9EURO|nr:hypothetical protein N7450_008081 [Penicillium hetheringtonii]